MQKLSDQDVALQVRRDNIDIAIDLMGYTVFPNWYFCLSSGSYSDKLSWLGTMGTDFMDYIVADHTLFRLKIKNTSAKSALSAQYIYADR